MTIITHSLDLDELIQVARHSLIARHGKQPERATHQEDVLAEFFPLLDNEFLKEYGPQMGQWEFTETAATPDERHELESAELRARLFDAPPNFEELVAWTEVVYRTQQTLTRRGMVNTVPEAVSSVLRYFWPDEIGSRDALWELVNSRPELLANLMISSNMEPRVALKLMIISEVVDLPEVLAVAVERSQD